MLPCGSHGLARELHGCNAAPPYTMAEKHRKTRHAALNDQMRAFCRYVVDGCQRKEAAVKAGYSERSASARAGELAGNPHVKAEIARLRAEAEQASVSKAAEVLDMVYAAIAHAYADHDWPNVYRGSELWLKATGNLVERRQVQTDQVIELEWTTAGGGDED